MFDKFKNFVVEHQVAIALTTITLTVVAAIVIEAQTDDREPIDAFIIIPE